LGGFTVLVNFEWSNAVPGTLVFVICFSYCYFYVAILSAALGILPVHLSVSPVTHKQKKNRKIKIGINNPQGMSKCSASCQLRSRSPEVKKLNCHISGVHV